MESGHNVGIVFVAVGRKQTGRQIQRQGLVEVQADRE